MGDGVGDGGRRADQGRLADPLGAERAGRFRLFDDDGMNVERQVERAEDLVVHHAGIDRLAVFPKQFLKQGIARALDEAAQDLALDRRRIDRAADVVGRPGAQDLHLSGHGIDLDLDDMGAEHIGADALERIVPDDRFLVVERLAVIDQRPAADDRAAGPVVRAQRDFSETQFPLRHPDDPRPAARPDLDVAGRAFEGFGGMADDLLAHRIGGLRHGAADHIGHPAAAGAPVVGRRAAVRRS
ncbi:MAG: hypothetical protein OXM58_07050 [Rhodospirillaceae bacterium]|nr:hypothetical protein [Rhodospirillaceae bacterium]MDE0619893.1 hypothetical protein [Rhodospirillaceae bacterium]